jgi:hypothetical protein
MLTIFSTAKPFRGADLTRQRNALRSWTLVHPDCQVILFGDVPGAREVAAELGIDHVPDVLRSEYGSVRLDDMFARAQEMARHDLICYANCDIIFLDSLARAVAATAEFSKTFLMIGQRWDTPIEGPITIHQNHDHSYHPAGLEGVRIDAESKRNRALAGGQRHLCRIEHATHRLIDGRVEGRPGRWHVPFTFFLGTYASQVWYWILKNTFKLRHALGLHRSTFVRADERARSMQDE